MESFPILTVLFMVILLKPLCIGNLSMDSIEGIISKGNVSSIIGIRYYGQFLMLSTYIFYNTLQELMENQY